MPRRSPSPLSPAELSENDWEGEGEDELSFEEHLKISGAHQDVCREAFLKYTERFEWKGKYLLHALSWFHGCSSDLVEAGLEKWPHVWSGGESRAVMAGMWDTRGPHSRLVVIWVLTPLRNRSSMYYLPGDWEDDAWEILQKEGKIKGFPASCQKSLYVSADCGPINELFCPALQGMGARIAPSNTKKSAPPDAEQRAEEELAKKEAKAPVAKSSMTVAQLKKLCQGRGLSTSGRKDDLIQRLNHGDSGEPTTQSKKRSRSQLAKSESKSPTPKRKKPRPEQRTKY